MSEELFYSEAHEAMLPLPRGMASKAPHGTATRARYSQKYLGRVCCEPCRLARNEYNRQFKAAPEKRKQYKLKARYGLTPKQYDDMLAAQLSRCAICGVESDALVVDHNHDTGAVRELCCKTCNIAVGAAKESVEILESIIAYLRKHNG